VTATSDENGRILGPAWGGADATVSSYDAWGSRRSLDGSATGPTSFNLQAGHRGFTSQETIPSVGLVNMNGRVYDPVLGRFLTADPNVQFVANLQSYNRYSYAQNNPLRYTDPTGYFSWGFLQNPEFWIAAGQVVFGAVACAAGPAACMAVGVAFALANATGAMISGAPFGSVMLNFELGVATGMLGGAVGGAVGNYAGSIVGGAVAGAVSGALTTAVTGGSLGKNMLLGAAVGAASAAITWSMTRVVPVSQASAEEQSQGRDDRRYGKSYAGEGHDPISCGEQGIVCGGNPNPKLDAFAKGGLDQQITITPNSGVVGVDDSVTVDLRTATKMTGREYLIGVLEDPKTHALSYTDPVEGNSIEAGGLRWKDGRLKLAATMHTHSVGAVDASDPFTVMDVNNKSYPVYRWSQQLNNILVYTPPTNDLSATIRILR